MFSTSLMTEKEPKGVDVHYVLGPRTSGSGNSLRPPPCLSAIQLEPQAPHAQGSILVFLPYFPCPWPPVCLTLGCLVGVLDWSTNF